MEAWTTAYGARSDLQAYGDNGLGLFALGLRFNIEDLNSIAADSITDGSDDKKCDIVYIEEADGIAVVTQCYFSANKRQAAPANKASDLNTAVAWLLQRPLKDLPDRIVSAAKQLRAGIEAGKIEKIHIWYVHNLPENSNVETELQTVEETCKSALVSRFKGRSVAISALEVGAKTLQQWYNETLTPILVNETFEVPTGDGFEVSGDKWKSYVTSVPAQFLYRAYKKHKTRLFSANVRDYLGSRSSDSNINNGIKKTAEQEPENFWVYNNGLTILTNSFDLMASGRKRILQISGMSIVNGAQTTGAIGSLQRLPSPSLRVPVRFVCTSDADLVHGVIQYNNSQNKVTASDFRSTDSIQKRLKEETRNLPHAEYLGGRRGGAADSIARRPNLMPSYTVGQALAALHGDPIVAYNQKTNIWINDKTYSRFFNEETTARHIVFAFSLLRAVEAKKFALLQKAKTRPEDLTNSEERQLSFFRKRGSVFLFVSALASCVETFLSRKVPNLFRLSFGERTSPRDAQRIWADIVDATIPLCQQLEEALNDGLKGYDRAKGAIEKFQSLVEATAHSNESRFKAFRVKVQTK